MHARCIAQRNGTIVMLQGQFRFAEAKVCIGDIAVVLAHCDTVVELFTYLEGLLVVIERLAEVTKQVVNAADVAERIADPARKVGP